MTREETIKEYLNHENNNYYNGIELLYATATPKERVRIEDNRICLENAIKEIERLESENAALRQQVKDMGEVIKELKASDEYHKVARKPPENPEKCP